MFAATLGAPRVPATAPDSVPAWVYADSNMVYDTSPHMAGNFPRDVLWVMFELDATLEQKQAAIDLVGGEVIGGSRISGDYLIRIPGDGTTDPMFEALALLQSLPQVYFVYSDAEMSAARRRH